MQIRVKVRDFSEIQGDTDYQDWRPGDILRIVSLFQNSGLLLNDCDLLDKLGGVGTRVVMTAPETGAHYRLVKRPGGPVIYIVWVAGAPKGVIANGTLVRVFKAERDGTEKVENEESF